jgi:hypothetical protein
MRSLVTHARPNHSLFSSHLQSPIITSLSIKEQPQAPRLKTLAPRIQKANYYWAANHQSYLIFSALLDSAAKNPDPQNYQKIKAALISLMESIIDRSSQSPLNAQACKDLLKLHLQGLSTNQLQQLAHILKISNFNYIGHEIIYEIVERNGRKKEREKMIELLSANQLFSLLNELATPSNSNIQSQHNLSFAPNWNSAVRKILFDATSIWNKQPHSKDADKILLKAAQDIATQLGLSTLLQQVEYCALNYDHSSVLLNASTLKCDNRLETALLNQKNSILTYLAPFERALRDVLELLLMKKMFGEDAILANLQAKQLHTLRSTIDVVLNQTAPEFPPELSLLASHVLKNSPTFGHIHISPNGSGSGHSWIAPDFSIFPKNGDGRQRIAGSVFLQEAKQLFPAPKKITEKSIDFISQEKNEKYFSSEDALMVTVPVPADVLQQSAQRIKERWINEDVLYKSMSDIDGGDVRSCRVGVWEAVMDGMDDSARQLFNHYNCGLPDPDSSAELWLRLQGFMQWVKDLAAQA